MYSSSSYVLFILISCIFWHRVISSVINVKKEIHYPAVRGHQVLKQTFASNPSSLTNLHPGLRDDQLRVRQGSLRGHVSFVYVMCSLSLSNSMFHSLIYSIYCYRMHGLSATASPTFTPIPGGEPVSRIRMYWQWGYTWQDKYTEEKYCLQCRNPGWDPRKGCQVGMKIEIDDCSTSHKQKFVRVNGDKTISPVMSPDLCISHQNHADDILLDTLSLEYCNGGKQQQFDIVGTPWQKWGKFEIRTSLTSQRQPTCLTNAHHPRRYENIFPQRCDREREHQTSSWTLY